MPQAFLMFLILVFGCTQGWAEERWSSRILNSMGEAMSPSGSSASRTVSEGQVLRTYQLKQLKLGEPGRSQSTVLLLEKLLPQGSALKLDVPANSLHILSTPSAHAAVWEFISAMDQAETSKATGSGMSEELRVELKRLGEGMAHDEKLQGALQKLGTDLGELSGRDSLRQKQLFLGLAGGVIIVSLVLVVLLRRSPQRRSAGIQETAGTPLSVAALLAPEKISSAMEPMQRQMQQEMLNALNAAALRMEAWHNEHKAQREQIEKLAQTQETSLSAVRNQLLEENRELLQRTNSRFEESAARIEEGVATLSVQNDRVGALAVELQTTVKELDCTKDQILLLQRELEGKSSQLDSTRQALSQRENELTRQQAKLAALTLILEEGAGIPDLHLSSAPLVPHKEPDLSQSSSSTSPCNPPTHTRARIRYQFLPPPQMQTATG